MRLALFISGSGTTATTIVKSCLTGKLAVDPVLVVASKKDIGGITRIQEAGLPLDKIVIINPKNYKDQDEFGQKLLDECDKYKVDLVGQYGWLPLTPKKFIKKFKGRIINQHPGPLDPPRADFGGKGMWGKRVHASILYFRRITKHDFWTEATTHFVTEEFDKGEVVKRKRVKILPNDTVEDLQKRVLPIEHETQIEALNDFVLGKVKICKRQKPLIRVDELVMLKTAKKIAAVFYPHG